MIETVVKILLFFCPPADTSLHCLDSCYLCQGRGVALFYYSDSESDIFIHTLWCDSKKPEQSTIQFVFASNTYRNGSFKNVSKHS